MRNDEFASQYKDLQIKCANYVKCYPRSVYNIWKPEGEVHTPPMIEDIELDAQDPNSWSFEGTYAGSLVFNCDPYDNTVFAVINREGRIKIVGNGDYE
jgi:hypothetical protein